MVDRTDSEAQRAEQAQRRFREGVEENKPRIHSEPAIKRDLKSPLKVFQGEVDWVVAQSTTDALAVLKEHYGSPYHENVGITEAEAREEWEIPCDPDSPLTIWTEPDDWDSQEPELGRIYANQWPVVFREQNKDTEYWFVKRTAPMWWWAQTEGRGFLCSSEY